MKKKITGLVIFALLIIILSSCSSEKKQDSDLTNQGEQIQTVKTEIVEYRDLQLFAHFTGKLEGITDIILYSEVTGKVTGIEKELGQTVKEGEPIADIDSKNFMISYNKAKSELKSATATLDATRIKAETAEKLYEKGQISKYEYINDLSSLIKAEATFEGAQADLEKAKMNYENSKFTSPVEGSIAKINIKEGQYIGLGQPVASIVDCSKLLIKTGVIENEILYVKKGNVAVISHNGTGNVIKGIVKGIGKKPDETGIYPVEIEMGNPGQKLLPGMMVEGKIETVALNDMIYTSYENLLEEFGRYYVFVAYDDGIINKKEVKPGKKYGNLTLIDKGLNIGDRLVVSGLETLSHGNKVKIYGE